MADEGCDTTLELCLGLGNRETSKAEREIGNNDNNKPTVCLDLSFSLGNSQGEIANNLDEQAGHEWSSSKTLEEKEKRGRKRVVDSVNSDGSTSAGKKLRLTKEQSSLLENCFKVHTTLTPMQKQTLAEQLNLKPRQVEVWFQNRRARTKLKQTEMDYEYLKRSCQSLTEENKKLKSELQELRSSLTMARSAPIFVHHVTRASSSNITTCPICDQVVASRDDKSLLILQQQGD